VSHSKFQDKFLARQETDGIVAWVDSCSWIQMITVGEPVEDLRILAQCASVNLQEELSSAGGFASCRDHAEAAKFRPGLQAPAESPKAEK
jgi:hypothetical protein